MSETAPGSIVLPETLTISQRECLRFVHLYANVRRVTGGWGLKGYASKYSDATVKTLTTKGLVRRQIVRGHPKLEITGNGRYTIAVMDERQRNKARAA
ncbi:MAG: hypothetical protein ACRCU5_13985 [Rhizobiaceae bacterium]